MLERAFLLDHTKQLKSHSQSWTTFHVMTRTTNDLIREVSGTSINLLILLHRSGSAPWRIASATPTSDPISPVTSSSPLPTHYLSFPPLLLPHSHSHSHSYSPPLLTHRTLKFTVRASLAMSSQSQNGLRKGARPISLPTPFALQAKRVARRIPCLLTASACSVAFTVQALSQSLSLSLWVHFFPRCCNERWFLTWIACLLMLLCVLVVYMRR